MTQSVEAMEASVRGIHEMADRLREQNAKLAEESERLAHELDHLRVRHEHLVARASMLEQGVEQAREHIRHLQAERDVAREKQTALAAQMTAAVSVLCEGIEKANHVHAPHGAVARGNGDDGEPVPGFLHTSLDETLAAERARQ